MMEMQGMPEAGEARVQGQDRQEIETLPAIAQLARRGSALEATVGAVAARGAAEREEAGRELAPQRVPMLNWPAMLFANEVGYQEARLDDPGPVIRPRLPGIRTVAGSARR